MASIAQIIIDSMQDVKDRLDDDADSDESIVARKGGDTIN